MAMRTIAKIETIQSGSSPSLTAIAERKAIMSAIPMTAQIASTMGYVSLAQCRSFIPADHIATICRSKGVCDATHSPRADQWRDAPARVGYDPIEWEGET